MVNFLLHHIPVMPRVHAYVFGVLRKEDGELGPRTKIFTGFSPPAACAHKERGRAYLTQRLMSKCLNFSLLITKPQGFNFNEREPIFQPGSLKHEGFSFG